MRRAPPILVLAFLGVALCVAATPEKGGPGRKPSLKQLFKRLDADGDGSLTEAEYVGRSRFGDTEKTRRIFHASDADGDGKVTETEYVDNRIVTDKAKEIFFWIDADDDGAMTRQEVAARIDRVFKEMDTSADGRVTIPEFMSSRWRWQVRIDWKKRDQVAPEKKAWKAKTNQILFAFFVPFAVKSTSRSAPQRHCPRGGLRHTPPYWTRPPREGRQPFFLVAWEGHQAASRSEVAL